MGTKSLPGLYDCYTQAEADEPIFTLRANDPLAPGLVMMWATLRNGGIGGAIEQLSKLANDSNVQFHIVTNPANPEKIEEAESCANAMLDWRANR